MKDTVLKDLDRNFLAWQTAIAVIQNDNSDGIMAESGGVGRCRIFLDSSLDLITLAFATTCNSSLLNLDN